MASAIDQLKAEVARVSVRLDEDKIIDRLSDELASKSAERVREALEAQEQRVVALGDAKASAAAQRLEEAIERSERTEKQARSLGRALTIQGVGRVALVLIPFALVAVAMALLLDLGSHVLGVGPLFDWAWSSFEAAEAWWSKSLIALATLTGAAGVLWLVKILGVKLADSYRGW